MIQQKCGKNKYIQASFRSNKNETYLTSWRLRGILIGASGRWASRVATSGKDSLGRCMDVQGKNGRSMRGISAYRVSQDSPAQAGKTTA